MDAVTWGEAVFVVVTSSMGWWNFTRAMLAAVFSGGRTIFRLKEPDEIAGILETARACDFVKGQVQLEQYGCLHQALLADIFVEGTAGFFAAEHAEVIGVQLAAFGQFFPGQVAIQMIFDIGFDLSPGEGGFAALLSGTGIFQQCAQQAEQCFNQVWHGAGHDRVASGIIQ